MSFATPPVALQSYRTRAAVAIRRRLASSPRLTLSAWANQRRMLSPEVSAEPAPWRTDRVPYLREIMDAVGDPDIPFMVVMKSAQVGYTEGIVNNGVGYFVDQDPSPIMIVQPSDGEADKWSKMKLATMLRDTPCLRGKVSEAKSRSSENTILLKMFPGGVLNIVGATSPKGLAAMPARVAFLDEVDRYPASAGTEGDPVKLVERRLTTFWNRKQVIGSTPTLKGVSRIEKAFELSDQRYYHVPCPHCGELQRLQWGGPDKRYGLKWEEGKPDTVAYLCAACGALIEESEKERMVRAGRWVPTNPDGRYPGWHINALISLFDGARWPLLVTDFLEAKDDRELLQVFVNTILGETWEERGEQLSPDALAGRAEKYPAEVPAGVGLLTAGVDVHADRLEVEVDGWAGGEENYLIAHHRLHGDPSQDEVWQRLEAVLTRAFQHETGATLRVRACMVDSGYKTTEVYRFVRPRQGRNVWASKGVDEKGKAPLSRPNRPNRDGVKVFVVGTVAMKDTLFARLRIRRPGPKYFHFCQPLEDGADAEDFAQLGAEKAVIRKVKGRPVRTYLQVRDRNEAIDLKVLNFAALYALGPRLREQLGKLALGLQQQGTAKPAAPPEGDDVEEPAEEEAPSARRRRPRGNRWVYRGWGT